LKWCFDEEVSLLISLQKKLKENKKGSIHNGYVSPAEFKVWNVAYYTLSFNDTVFFPA
jgi:hypothetical protein